MNVYVPAVKVVWGSSILNSLSPTAIAVPAPAPAAAVVAPVVAAGAATVAGTVAAATAVVLAVFESDPHAATPNSRNDSDAVNIGRRRR